MKIYIACGLTHVPRDKFAEHAGFIHQLAATLREEIDECAVKYALVDSDPQLRVKPSEERARLCYLWDREMVEEADLVIAEASFPSTGLGIEMQIAEARGTPIILCFRDFGTNKAATVEYENPDRTHHHLQVGDGYVTLMALGIPTILRIIQYSAEAEGISSVLEATKLLAKPQLMRGA